MGLELPICPELAGYSMSRNRSMTASNRNNNSLHVARKFTEENHGGGDGENNNKPTVQVYHSPQTEGTAVKLRLTGVKYAARQGDRERERGRETTKEKCRDIQI